MSRQQLNLFGETLMIGEIEASVIRSPRRRSVEVQVHRNQVIVRAPERMPARHLYDELQSSADWVRGKLRELGARPAPVERRFVSGERIPCLGEDYILRVRRGPRSGVTADAGRLDVVLGPRVKRRADYARRAIEKWLIERAAGYLHPRTKELAAAMGVRVRGIEIKSFKSHWGSCSSRGELTFNWRIVMAPPDIVDYVIAHELAHRVEFNHSKRFWRVVAKAVPDYRKRRRWLQDHADLLSL